MHLYFQRVTVLSVSYCIGKKAVLQFWKENCLHNQIIKTTQNGEKHSSSDHSPLLSEYCTTAERWKVSITNELEGYHVAVFFPLENFSASSRPTLTLPKIRQGHFLQSFLKLRRNCNDPKTISCSGRQLLHASSQKYVIFNGWKPLVTAAVGAQAEFIPTAATDLLG